MNALLLRNRKFVRSVNPECGMYTRLVYQNSEEFNLQVNNRYRSLVFKYADAWTREFQGEETVIVSSFPKNMDIYDNVDVMMWGGMTPFLALSYSRNPKDCYESPCETINVMKTLSPTFGNIGLLVGLLNDKPCPIYSNCPSIQQLAHDNPVPFLKSKTTVILDGENEVDWFVNNLVENEHALINIETIYFYWTYTTFYSSTWNHTVSLLQAKNIEIGCFVEHKASTRLAHKYDIFSPLEKVIQKCGPLLNVSSKVLYWTEPEISDLPEHAQFLVNLQQKKVGFEGKFPDKEFVPAVSRLYPKSQPETSVMVYCDNAKLVLNEYYTAVLTFANIHGWSNFVLRELVDQDNSESTAWLQNIQTNEEIDRYATDFPVLVHTNGAKSLWAAKKVPFAHQCMVWTEGAPESGIGFSRNNNSGTYVPMNFGNRSSLSVRELQTLLLFAIGKFSTVELVANNEINVETAYTALTTEFIQFVGSSSNFVSSKSPLIYLEAPINLTSHLNTRLASLPQNVAVHFSGWEMYETSQHEMVTSTLSTNQLGITVQNCSHEVNLKLERLKKLPFISSLNYIVCNVSPVLPTNGDRIWMNKYLNTLFYIKTYIQTFFLTNGHTTTTTTSDSIEIIFRLNFIAKGKCGKKRESYELDNLLQFLNDVNQHSLAYKMRYVMVRAFDNNGELSDGCTHSWWRIDNFTDLTNVSVYTDREQEKFGRPTKRVQLPPVPLKDDISKNQGSNAIFPISIIAVVSISLVLIFALWLRYSRMRTRYLSEKEINDFYNGESEEDMELTNMPHWLGITFSKSLEIPKRNIELGRLIGSGEFGQVFLGKLNEEIEVAVKVPRPNECVEVFKAVLSEVKILCHVGVGSTHPNVILFMGAYTKEITRGKLYIVTEYCKNGSLQTYLRSHQTGSSGDDGPSSNSVDLYQMCRFAYEIASGMDYISGKRVIHGDLASRNVFLDCDYTCKIGDFGLSRKLYQLNEYIKKSEEPLPWRWMSIESLKIMEFSTKSDVWSYGITLWEIFSLGAIPYPGILSNANFLNELEAGMRMGKAQYASADIHQKLLDCWNQSAEGRPAFSELAQYFSGLRSDEYTTM